MLLTVGELVCCWDHSTMKQQVCHRCESLKATGRSKLNDTPELDPFVSEAQLVLVLPNWMTKWCKLSKSIDYSIVKQNLRNFQYPSDNCSK